MTPTHHPTVRQGTPKSLAQMPPAQLLDMDATPDSRPDWVPESAFGRWFLGTTIWRDYVLEPAVQQLAKLAGSHFPHQGHLVDLGCGEALSLPLVASAFQPGRITALDIDPEALDSARSKYSNRREAPSLSTTFIRASATRLPLADRSVDAVFCHQLLHHLYRQSTALQEIRRVLRPGGLLMLSESCRSFIESWPVRLLFRHPKGIQRDATDYVRAVQKAGFTVDDGDVITSRPWWSTSDLRVLERLLPPRTVRPVKWPPTEVLLVGQRPIKHTR